MAKFLCIIDVLPIVRGCTFDAKTCLLIDSCAGFISYHTGCYLVNCKHFEVYFVMVE